MMSVQVMIARMNDNDMRVAVFMSTEDADRWRKEFENLGYTVTRHPRQVQ